VCLFITWPLGMGPISFPETSLTKLTNNHQCVVVQKSEAVKIIFPAWCKLTSTRGHFVAVTLFLLRPFRRKRHHQDWNRTFSVSYVSAACMLYHLQRENCNSSAAKFCDSFVKLCRVLCLCNNGINIHNSSPHSSEENNLGYR